VLHREPPPAPAPTIESTLVRAGVPARFRVAAEPENDERHAAWMRKRSVVFDEVERGGLVVMCGTRGSGKTRIACEAIAEAIVRRRVARYTKALDFFIDLRSPMHTGKESEHEVLRRYTHPQLLVIDEVHERGGTAWEDRLLTHVIDTRYSNMLATVMIANLTVDAFEAHLGASAWDRIVGSGIVVVCDWPSFRKTAAQEGKRA